MLIKINVKNQPDGYHPHSLEPPRQIVLDHERFHFNSTTKTIAWRFENNQTCTTSMIFTIQSSVCDLDDPIGTWTTQNTELTLPSSEFVNKNDSELLVYFSISASDENQPKCHGSSPIFQIPPKREYMQLVYYNNYYGIL